MAIVDDDQAMLRALARVLRSAGYSAETFAGGAEFLRSPGTPDCLLLDLDMPETSGLDVLGHLLSRGLRIPTVILTGSIQLRFPELQVGGRTFSVLRKPVDDQVLLDAVAEAIRRGA